MATSRQKQAYTTPQGTVVMLTPQQKAYADAKLDAKPTQSKTELVQAINSDITKGTAQQLVKQYENNQSISIYTSEQVSQARSNIVSIANDVTGVKAETRLKANQDILDRTEGKARQQIDIQSTAITLSIDLTSALATDENTNN